MAIQLKNHIYNANNIDALVDNKVSTINDIVSELESKLTTDIQSINKDIESLSIYTEDFKVKLKNLIQKEENDISGLNKKTELLFKQIDSTNRLIYSYVQEQLFNIEKVRLEMKRENLMHYIYEQIIDRQIYYIASVPWYKKITKKQREKISNNIKKIHQHTMELSKSAIEEVELEIKNHTRDNFFSKLNNITKEIKKQINVAKKIVFKVIFEF